MSILIIVIKSTIILLAGIATYFILRRAVASVRHAVLLSSLIAVLVAPCLSAFPFLEISVPASLSLPGAEADRLGSIADSPARAESMDRTFAAAPAEPGVSELRNPVGLVGVIWLGGALIVLLWFAAGELVLWTVRRRAAPIEPLLWRSLCRELGVTRAPLLLASPHAVGPFLSGLIRPTIILPAGWTAWRESELRLVLMHELAHVARRDLLAQAAARLACILYWFHPLVWIASGRLRLESERACDHHVLTKGALASDYAEQLLTRATDIGRAGGLIFAMSETSLYRSRIKGILDANICREQPKRRQLWWAQSPVAAILILVAPSAVVAEPSPTSAATAVPTVGRASLKPASGALARMPQEGERQHIAQVAGRDDHSFAGGSGPPPPGSRASRTPEQNDDPPSSRPPVASGREVMARLLAEPLRGIDFTAAQRTALDALIDDHGRRYDAVMRSSSGQGRAAAEQVSALLGSAWMETRALLEPEQLSLWEGNNRAIWLRRSGQSTTTATGAGQ